MLNGRNGSDQRVIFAFVKESLLRRRSRRRGCFGAPQETYDGFTERGRYGENRHEAEILWRVCVLNSHSQYRARKALVVCRRSLECTSEGNKPIVEKILLAQKSIFAKGNDEWGRVVVVVLFLRSLEGEGSATLETRWLLV